MKNFHVYANDKRHLVATPVGFSFFAMFYGDPYYVAKGLWTKYFAVVTVGLVAALLFYVLSGSNALGAIPVLASFAFVGSQANGWAEDKLQREGYKRIGKCSARSAQDALRKWGQSASAQQYFAKSG